MWPVGLVTDLGVSSPIVKNGRVVGFYDGWNGLRKFPVDMAGFAINIQLFRDVSHHFGYSSFLIIYPIYRMSSRSCGESGRAKVGW
jgi:hypothetical protein